VENRLDNVILFSMDLDLKKHAKNGKPSVLLRKQFEGNNVSLPENVGLLGGAGQNTWIIHDKNGRVLYVIKREGGSLNIYHDTIKTYISGLDNEILCNGGIIRGSNIVVIGNPGTGKTTFAMQFLYQGVTKDDDIGVLRSFDITATEKMYQDALNFGWNMQDLEDHDKINRISVTVEQMESMVSEAANAAGPEADPEDETLLFSVSSECQGELNRGKIPDELRDKFYNDGTFFSESVDVSQKADGEWEIDDKNTKREYIARREDCGLNIYDRTPIPAILIALKLYDLLKYCRKEKRHIRLVIDNLRPLIEYFAIDSPHKARECIYDLFHQLTNTEEITAVIVCEEMRTEDKSISFPEYLADVLIRLTLEETSNGRRNRFLELEKTRGQSAILGKHSFKIRDKEGIHIYPRFAPPHPEETTSSDIDPGKKLTSGIKGLDEMLSGDGLIKTNGGLIKNTSTALIGEAGTGKSTVGIQFLTAGGNLDEDEHGLLVSLEQMEQTAIDYSRGLPLPDTNKTDGKSFEQLVKDDVIKILAPTPVGICVDEFFHDIKDLIRSSQEEDGKAIKRVVIDSITDLESVLDENQLGNLVLCLSDLFRVEGITSIFIVEIPVHIGEVKMPESGISLLTDSVVVLRHVPVSERMRKTIFVWKVRGGDYDPGVRELVMSRNPDSGELESVEVKRSFEGIKGLLIGKPEPANLFLKLFYENEHEREFNEKLESEFQRRFFNLQVKSALFSKASLQDILMEELDGKAQHFELPHSNIKVSCLDEYWVPELSKNNRLVRLDDYVDVPQIRDRLLDEIKEKKWVYAAPDEWKEGYCAVPNYVDVGLFLYRKDLLDAYGLPPPETWEQVKTYAKEICKGEQKRGRGLVGFAFETTLPDTLTAAFLEILWNKGGRLWHEVLDTAEEQDDNRTRGKVRDAGCGKTILDSDEIKETVEFILGLVHDGITPGAYTSEQCVNAVFSRQWYSTWVSAVENLAKDDPDAAERLVSNTYVMEMPAFQEGAKKRHSAWGEWYLGILRGSVSVRLAWALINETIRPDKIRERADMGAGLPAWEEFYRLRGDSQIPHLNLTYNSLREMYYKNAISRAEVPDYRKVVSAISGPLELALAGIGKNGTTDIESEVGKVLKKMNDYEKEYNKKNYGQ